MTLTASPEAPHRASSKAGEPTQGWERGCGSLATPGSHSISARCHRAAQAGHRPRTPRSHARSPEPRAVLKCPLGSAISDCGVQGSTVKTHNLHIQTSVKRGCLMGKKSQSQNIWPHGNRQWQGIFLYNET